MTEGNEQKMVAPCRGNLLMPQRARLDQTLPVGNEGAGHAIAAGANAKHLEGKMVSPVSGQCYRNSSKHWLSCARPIMMTPR